MDSVNSLTSRVRLKSTNAQKDFPRIKSKYLNKPQLIFNSNFATKGELSTFVDVLEYYLYKKAKGKTEVKLNTRGLYKEILIVLLERPNGLEERYKLPKGGKAWGLAVSRMLTPEIGDFIGHWYSTSDMVAESLPQELTKKAIDKNIVNTIIACFIFAHFWRT